MDTDQAGWTLLSEELEQISISEKHVEFCSQTDCDRNMKN